MEWYFILLIVLGSILGAILLLLGILFIVYITNSDLKMVEKIYNKLLDYHDKKHIETKI